MRAAESGNREGRGEFLRTLRRSGPRSGKRMGRRYCVSQEGREFPERELTTVSIGFKEKKDCQ